MTKYHHIHYRDLLEKRINEWANSIAHEYKLEKNSFRIKLKEDKGPKPTPFGRQSYFPKVAEVSNGAVVEITLYIPWIEKSDGDIKVALNKLIKRLKKNAARVLNYISTPSLHQDNDFFNPLMISDIMHELVKGAHGGMIWQPKKFDPSLVHGHRKQEFHVDIQKEVKVTFTHKETGVSYTVVDTTNRREWDLTQECWEKCSELVELELEEREEREERRELVPASFYENQAREWLVFTEHMIKGVH